MGVNVVNYGGKTLVDMRNATATAETVLAGYTAYGADGDLVVGTMTPTLHKTVSVTLSKNLWIDNQQTVSVDFATAEAMVIAGGEPESQEYFDCEVWCSGQDDGRLIFSCTYEPMEDVIANIGMLMTGELVISYARGSTIQLTDAAERKLRGLTIYGKTTQNGTPSPTAPVPMVSAGDGGSIGVSVAGKNLVNIEAFTLTMGAGRTKSIFLDKYLPAGVYTVQFMVSNAVLNGKRASLQIVLETGEEIEVSTYGNGLFSAPFHAALKIRSLYFYIASSAGADATATFSNVQLQAGETASDYEPYIEPQTMIHQTPNGLPGIHVSEGGNYTDENGWQWICDEVDFGRGKRVQRVLKLGFSDLAGFSRQNGESDTENRVMIAAKINKLNAMLMYYRTGECNMFAHSKKSVQNKEVDITAFNFNNEAVYSQYVYFKLEKSYFSSLDDATVLSEFQAMISGIEIICTIPEPIEPDLSAEELAQYAALHTYSPSTTIYTNTEADMMVRYVKE